MTNPNPKNQFQKGNRIHRLRRHVGRPVKALVSPDVSSADGFRYVFNSYIRQKTCKWFEEDCATDTTFIKIIKKLGRDMVADSTTIKDIIALFRYLEPLTKEDLEGEPRETISAVDKEFLDYVKRLNLEGLRKVCNIMEDKTYWQDKYLESINLEEKETVN